MTTINNALPNLTQVDGNFAISDHTALTSVTNSFNALTKIGLPSTNGYFWIRDNSALTTVNTSFNALQTVEWNFAFSQNNALNTISGFNALTNVGTAANLGYFWLRDNPALANINAAFGALQTVAGNFALSRNGLTTLSGFNALTSVGQPSVFGDIFEIDDNDLLTSISGFNGLTNLEAHFNIFNHAMLSTITGFNNLTRIGSATGLAWLWIYNNAMLTGTPGITKLKETYGNFGIEINPKFNTLTNFSSYMSLHGWQLRITSNAVLASLVGLDNLDYSQMTISISGNANLSYCHVKSICDELNFDGLYGIVANKTDCNTPAEVQAFCAPPPCIPLPTFPANGSIGAACPLIPQTLTWPPSMGATGYDVYWGTTPTPPLVSANQPGTSYIAPGVPNNTLVYWRVVPRKAFPAIGCVTWTYTARDVIPPVLIGVPLALTLNCQDAIPAPPIVTASDNCTVNPVVTLTQVSTKGTSAAACNFYNYTITRTWSVSDAVGNITMASQLITVRDITPPTVTPPSNLTINCQDPVPGPPTLTTSDNCATGFLTINHATASTQGTNPALCSFYNYTITHTSTVTDPCLNPTVVSRTVTVQDVTPPTVSTPPSLTINCQDPVPGVPTVTTADNCASNNLTITSATISTKGTNPALCSFYNYTVTHTITVKDPCNNTTVVGRTVTVQDVTKPSITTKDPLTFTLNCQDNIPAPSATSLDNCDATPALTVVEDNKQNPNVFECGHYTYNIFRTWTAVDKCNNVNTVTQVIKVQDITPPAIFNAPVDATLECDEMNNKVSVYAVDNCFTASNSGNAPYDFQCKYSKPPVGLCPSSSYVATLVWTFYDVCGNTSEVDQRLVITDLSAPEITCPDNITVQSPNGNAVAVTWKAPATFDNCDAKPLLQLDNGKPSGSTFPAGSTNKIQYSAWDQCGNKKNLVPSMS